MKKKKYVVYLESLQKISIRRVLDFVIYFLYWGLFNNYVDKMRGGSCFRQRSGYKNCPHKEGEGGKWQKSVHVVVE